MAVRFNLGGGRWWIGLQQQQRDGGSDLDGDCSL